jgi:hypothetical protein
MAIIEEVPESPERYPSPPPPANNISFEVGPAPLLTTLNSAELAQVLRNLSATLALPEDLLPSFLSEEKRELQ